jgi:sulfur dioxygenase
MPQTAAPKPRIKQFRLEGCVSYCVFDGATRDTLLIDPHLSLMDEYREYLSEYRLKLRIALDTATHGDHYSASHLLRAETGCEIAMSARTESARPTRKLSAGEKLTLGSFSFDAIDTPGYSTDSICLAGHGMLFTGDTLHIGATGPLGLPGSDSEQMWKSVHDQLASFSDSTVVCPGHDHNNLLFSTLATERKKNRSFATSSHEEFAKLKRAEKYPLWDGNPAPRIAFNRAQSPTDPVQTEASTILRFGLPKADLDRIGNIKVEKYLHKLEERARANAFIDVREPEEFRAGHMPGSRNIPMGEVPLHLVELAQSGRVYISCLSGRRSGWAARTLAYVGFKDVVNVSGGFKAWLQAGLPVER